MEKFLEPMPRIGWEAIIWKAPCHIDHLPVQVSALSYCERVEYRSQRRSPIEGEIRTRPVNMTNARPYTRTVRPERRISSRGASNIARGAAASTMSPVRDWLASIPTSATEPKAPTKNLVERRNNPKKVT